MGIQINTQPQVFTSLSSSAISATNLFNSSGIDIISRTNTLFTTVTGITGSRLTSPSLSAQTLTAGSGVFNTSISATAISAVKFYGDGSELKNIAGLGAGVTSVNGLTGVVTNVVTTSGATLTGNLLAPALSSQTLTAGTGIFNISVSAAGISGTNFYTTSAGGYLSGGNNLTSIFGAKSTVDSTYSTVNTNSANWNSSYTTVQGSSADWTVGKTLSSSGGRLGGNVTVAGNLTANYITALSGATFVNTTFTTTSSLCVNSLLNAGPAFFVGANGTGDIASFYDIDSNVEVLHIGGANDSFPNVGIKTSSPTETLTISGTISASSNAWFNNIIANNDSTAKRATFTTSVSSPAVSGTHYGNGANLTSLSADNISSGTLNNSRLPSIATFTTSVSSPEVSGTHYGNGANLTSLSADNISSGTLNNSRLPSIATFTTSVSSPALSSNTLILSGYPITPVTTVYSVANGATATYTVALSDNNNTITLNLGTSGIVVLLSGIAYPVGFQTNVIQLSTGRITLSGSGITLNNDLSSYRTYGRYSAATIINLGSAWVCYGSLSS